MYVPLLHNRHFSQSQIEELKVEINKTEYEKSREPLNKEIQELNKEIWHLREEINAYKQVFNDIVSSLDKDYIKLYIREEPLEVQFGKISEFKITQDNLKVVDVPIKDMLRSEIYRKVAEKYNNLKGKV